MTPISPMQASTNILLQLAGPAARAFAVACLAGLWLAVFRVKTASLRLFTWTAVLYAALAMPLLEQLLPPLPVPTPAFFHSEATQLVPPEVQVAHPALDFRNLSPHPDRFPVKALALPRSSPRTSIPLSAIAVAVYFGIAFLLLARFFIGLTLGHRLLKASQIIEQPRISQRLASRAYSLGLAAVPQAAESELIAVPVTLGSLSPTILLPANWREWDDAKLDAVVAHEVSHVARGDALTQRLSLVHCAIFWFSPLAWWLDRHLADLAEQASDEAVLSGGVDRSEYARTLLGFFEALQAAPGRVWWQGISMASAGQAEQRVERILAWKGSIAMGFKKSIAVVIALAVPVVYLAASAHPAYYNVGPQTVVLAQAATPPSPAAPPRAPHPPKAPSVSNSSYAFGYDDESHFVIVSGSSDSLTMSGSTHDAEHVQELRKTIPGDFIWLKRGAKSYIVRDQATIDRARAFWVPGEQLGKQQEELGQQQEALGIQQEELGDKMEQIHVNVPDMTAELDKLKAKLKQLNSSATMEQIGEIQSEIGDLQSKIGELQSEAGEQQSKLGEQMGALGEQQGKLGEEQGRLGARQSELAQHASRQMKQLLDEAIAKGTAQLEQ